MLPEEPQTLQPVLYPQSHLSPQQQPAKPQAPTVAGYSNPLVTQHSLLPIIDNYSHLQQQSQVVGSYSQSPFNQQPHPPSIFSRPDPYEQIFKWIGYSKIGSLDRNQFSEEEIAKDNCAIFIIALVHIFIPIATWLNGVTIIAGLALLIWGKVDPTVGGAFVPIGIVLLCLGLLVLLLSITYYLFSYLFMRLAVEKRSRLAQHYLNSIILGGIITYLLPFFILAGLGSSNANCSI